MTHPSHEALNVADDLADAGAFATTVIKAARFAELTPETVDALSAAAAVVEQHGFGFMPQSGTAGALAVALGAFVTAMRERARAERSAA